VLLLLGQKQRLFPLAVICRCPGGLPIGKKLKDVAAKDQSESKCCRPLPPQVVGYGLTGRKVGSSTEQWGLFLN
jgi:hypothetical protein